MGANTIISGLYYGFWAAKDATLNVAGAIGGYAGGTLLNAIQTVVLGFKANRARKRGLAFQQAVDRSKGEEETTRGQWHKQQLKKMFTRTKEQEEVEAEQGQRSVESQLEATGERVVEEMERSERIEFLLNSPLMADKDMRFEEAAQYFADKNARKEIRTGVATAAALTATAGGGAVAIGLIAGGVTLAALLASNPIGWGVALVLAGGTLAYLIGSSLRKWRRKKKQEREGRTGERKAYAEALVDLVLHGHQPATALLMHPDLSILLPPGQEEPKTKSKWQFWKHAGAKINIRELYDANTREETKEKVIQLLMSKGRSW